MSDVLFEPSLPVSQHNKNRNQNWYRKLQRHDTVWYDDDVPPPPSPLPPHAQLQLQIQQQNRHNLERERNCRQQWWLRLASEVPPIPPQAPSPTPYTPSLYPTTTSPAAPPPTPHTPYLYPPTPQTPSLNPPAQLTPSSYAASPQQATVADTREMRRPSLQQADQQHQQLNDNHTQPNRPVERWQKHQAENQQNEHDLIHQEKLRLHPDLERIIRRKLQQSLQDDRASPSPSPTVLDDEQQKLRQQIVNQHQQLLQQIQQQQQQIPYQVQQIQQQHQQTQQQQIRYQQQQQVRYQQQQQQMQEQQQQEQQKLLHDVAVHQTNDNDQLRLVQQIAAQLQLYQQQQQQFLAAAQMVQTTKQSAGLRTPTVAPVSEDTPGQQENLANLIRMYQQAGIQLNQPALYNSLLRALCSGNLGEDQQQAVERLLNVVFENQRLTRAQARRLSPSQSLVLKHLQGDWQHFGGPAYPRQPMNYCNQQHFFGPAYPGQLAQYYKQSGGGAGGGRDSGNSSQETCEEPDTSGDGSQGPSDKSGQVASPPTMLDKLILTREKHEIPSDISQDSALDQLPDILEKLKHQSRSEAELEAELERDEEETVVKKVVESQTQATDKQKQVSGKAGGRKLEEVEEKAPEGEQQAQQVFSSADSSTNPAINTAGQAQPAAAPLSQRSPGHGGHRRGQGRKCSSCELPVPKEACPSLETSTSSTSAHDQSRRTPPPKPKRKRSRRKGSHKEDLSQEQNQQTPQPQSKPPREHPQEQNKPEDDDGDQRRKSHEQPARPPSAPQGQLVAGLEGQTGAEPAAHQISQEKPQDRNQAQLQQQSPEPQQRQQETEPPDQLKASPQGQHDRGQLSRSNLAAAAAKQPEHQRQQETKPLPQSRHGQEDRPGKDGSAQTRRVPLRLGAWMDYHHRRCKWADSRGRWLYREEWPPRRQYHLWDKRPVPCLLRPPTSYRPSPPRTGSKGDSKQQPAGKEQQTLKEQLAVCKDTSQEETAGCLHEKEKGPPSQQGVQSASADLRDDVEVVPPVRGDGVKVEPPVLGYDTKLKPSVPGDDTKLEPPVLGDDARLELPVLGDKARIEPKSVDDHLDTETTVKATHDKQNWKPRASCTLS